MFLCIFVNIFVLYVADFKSILKIVCFLVSHVLFDWFLISLILVLIAECQRDDPNAQ